MKNFILKLAEDFNNYSELVALNYEQVEEGECPSYILDWNRGHLNNIYEYLQYFCEVMPGVSLKWEFGEHDFGFDGWKRKLKYKTVQVFFKEV